jgi:hypothetical protein
MLTMVVHAQRLGDLQGSLPPLFGTFQRGSQTATSPIPQLIVTLPHLSYLQRV